MKKFIILALAILVTLTILACGEKKEAAPAVEETAEKQAQTPEVVEQNDTANAPAAEVTAEPKTEELGAATSTEPKAESFGAQSSGKKTTEPQNGKKRQPSDPATTRGESQSERGSN